MTDHVPLWLPEETTATPASLFKIGFFAAFAFLGMAAMLDGEARLVPLFVGGLILVLLAITGVWLWFQQRYGEAVLRAKTHVIGGRVFEGVIETGLTSVPSSPVRIILLGWYEGARVEVPPERMTISESGTVHIPFAMPIPVHEFGRQRGPVRLYVRSTTWPLGWGATFLLFPPFSGNPE